MHCNQRVLRNIYINKAIKIIFIPPSTTIGEGINRIRLTNHGASEIFNNSKGAIVSKIKPINAKSPNFTFFSLPKNLS